MKAVSLTKEISSTSYPGRGIVLGRSADGTKAVVAYFIMGRSENSRNRVFVETVDGIKTEAFDPSKLTDPSLIIYAPVRVLGNKTIVTNGDQTDTVYDLMNQQLTFEQALRTREFEPDAPNYTPRISGIVKCSDGKMNYAMSILKSACGNPGCCERYGDEDIDAFAEGVWNALDDDNKVSLFVRYIDVATGKAESRIINKNQ